MALKDLWKQVDNVYQQNGVAKGVDDSSTAVRKVITKDGQRAFSVIRFDADGNERTVRMHDAVEAALWRETDLNRASVPDVEGTIDPDRLEPLARGEVEAITIQVGSHTVTVRDDGTVTVDGSSPALRGGANAVETAPGTADDEDQTARGQDSNTIGGHFEALGRSIRDRTDPTVRRLWGSLERQREAMNRWLDDDVSSKVGTVKTIKTSSGEHSDDPQKRTTVVANDRINSLSDRLGPPLARFRRTWTEEGSEQDNDSALGSADGVSDSGETVSGRSEGSTGNLARRNRSNAVSVIRDENGQEKVVVDRLDRHGGTRQVPVEDVLAAALWRESELGRPDIPDVATEIDRDQFLALAQGERENVTVRLAGHLVTVAADGTVDVQAGPLTRCRTVIANAPGVADDEEGSQEESAEVPRGVFARGDGDDAGVFVARLDNHGGTQEVPIEDAIEAALWRETDLDRTAIPDIGQEVDHEQLVALANGQIESLTVRLSGCAVLVHGDGTVTVRAQARAPRRSILKVAGVAGAAASMGLAASGGTQSEEPADGDPEGTGRETTTTVKHGFGGTSTTVAKTMPDGTEVVQTVDHRATETTTDTATEVRTEDHSDTPAATETVTQTAEEEKDPGGGGGDPNPAPNPPSSGPSNEPTTTQTEARPTIATSTETQRTETSNTEQTEIPEPGTGEDSDDEYGEQRYGEHGYGGVAAT